MAMVSATNLLAPSQLKEWSYRVDLYGLRVAVNVAGYPVEGSLPECTHGGIDDEEEDETCSSADSEQYVGHDERDSRTLGYRHRNDDEDQDGYIEACPCLPGSWKWMLVVDLRVEW